MRRALVLTLLAACGRFGFASEDGGGAIGDGRGDSSGGDGSDPDVTPPQGCSAVQLALTLDASPVTNVIASELPGGVTALGFINDASSALKGAVIDAQGVPNADPPFRTTPVAGATYTYHHASLFWNGSLLTGSVSVIDDGSCYLKTFMPDMSTFVIAVQRLNCQTGEPSVGRAGQATVSTWYDATTVFYNSLMSDGNPGAMDYSIQPGSMIDNLSVAGSDTYAVVAIDSSDGACRYVATAGAAAATSGMLASPCAKPHIRLSPDGFDIVYEASATTIAWRAMFVPSLGAITFGPASTPVAGRLPRLFRANNENLIAYEDASQRLAVLRLDGTVLPVTGLPAAAPNAFEGAGAHVFATFGTAVYEVSCP